MASTKTSVLLAHNFYRSSNPSGENVVFEMERALLLGKGHEVKELRRHSDELVGQGAVGLLKGALFSPWNNEAASVVKERLLHEKSDVLHVHNTFPMFSPSIFWASRGLAARVLTLHNYRVFCPNAIPMRDGKVCTDCLDRRSVAPAMIHGCYRGSRLATTPLAMNVALHRAIGTWRNQVDAFICLSEFQKEMMISAGLPRYKVHVKPNFYPGMPTVVPWEHRRPAVVFAGRLGAEKGVVSLLKAWSSWGPGSPELRIVGDGPLLEPLREMAKGLRVVFLGQLPAEEAQREISQSMLQILPSEWFEGFPMVIREAFAFGTPTAVSNLGPLPSIVTDGKNGVVFEPADPSSLLREVKRVWNNPQFLQQLGEGAREEFESKYTEEANYEQLMGIYSEAKEVANYENSKR